MRSCSIPRIISENMQSRNRQLYGNVNERLNEARQKLNEDIRKKLLGNAPDPNKALDEHREGLNKEILDKVAKALKRHIDRNPRKENVMYF